MSFVKISILGNIGQDATIKEVNGRFVINFSIAHNEKFTDSKGVKQERTTWFSCAIWKESRDKTRIAEYLKAGQIVHIEGTPEIRIFDSKQGKSAAINVQVSAINFAGSAPQKTPAPPAATNEQFENPEFAAAGFNGSVDDLPY